MERFQLIASVCDYRYQMTSDFSKFTMKHSEFKTKLWYLTKNYSQSYEICILIHIEIFSDFQPLLVWRTEMINWYWFSFFVPFVPLIYILQNWELWSVPTVFGRGGVLIGPSLFRHLTSVYTALSEGPLRSIASYDRQWILGIHSKPEPHEELVKAWENLRRPNITFLL